MLTEVGKSIWTALSAQNKCYFSGYLSHGMHLLMGDPMLNGDAIVQAHMHTHVHIHKRGMIFFSPLLSWEVL